MNTLHTAISLLTGPFILAVMVKVTTEAWREHDYTMFAVAAFASLAWMAVVWYLIADVVA